MLARRLFLSGLIMMGLFALGHLAGFLQAANAARHDPQMAELTRAMSERKDSVLGLHPSLLDFREYFSLNFSILLLLASVLGFAMMATGTDRSVIIHTLSPWYTVAMLLLLGTSVYFSVAHGIILCPIIGVLFVLAWWFG